MSLNYNLEKCDKLTDEIRQNFGQEITNVIHACMVVQIGELKTDKDVREFQERLDAFAFVTGNDWSREIRIVPLLKGLSTNVFPRWSEKKFAAHLGEIALRGGVERQKREREGADKRAAAMKTV